MLNPMVQSDLVTYRGVTILILFLQATNTLQPISACLIPVYFGGHPILALTAICDCGLAAWLGHDGFQWPGSSNYFHMLHHSQGYITIPELLMFQN